jgi:hypothetical protein
VVTDDDGWENLRLIIGLGNSHRWARNLKNVAPQMQNAICKTREQFAKCNCIFELLKAHCAETINAKNTSFHKKFLKRKEHNCNFIK